MIHLFIYAIYKANSISSVLSLRERCIKKQMCFKSGVQKNACNAQL